MMATPMPLHDVRRAGGAELAAALRDSRRDTLATFATYERALAATAMTVPLRAELNPPLWELGHVGWFQEYWIGRFPARRQGPLADPDAPRTAPLRANADALYDSSRVAHDSRWSLPLPDAETTRAELAAQLEQTLALLAATPAGDDGLYFFRLALMHEDMHHEAALYMAQALGLPVDDSRWQPAATAGERAEVALAAGRFRVGHDGAGFAFDNELAAHAVDAAACRIDSRVLSWAEYLPFVEAGGYAQPQWWPGAAGAWLAGQRLAAPRYLRHQAGAWQQWRWGRWVDLDPALPACHLSGHEAAAWCAWAGRRLPSEAEWERAAVERPGEFAWGQVWEWTASDFVPYAGFTPHPYRDYSAPWFGQRRVLRGASLATQPRLRHPRYRNFYAPERNDIYAGFRSCAP